MSLENLSNFEAMTQAANEYYNTADIWSKIGSLGIDSAEAAEVLKKVPGVTVKQSDDVFGTILDISYTKQQVISSGDPISGIVDSNTQSGTALVSREINIPAAMGADEETGLATLSSGVNRASGLSQGLKFISTSVVPAVAAAGTGITLGKLIDSGLYNINPDFWDSHGMAALNPETWSSITYQDDSLGARAFNALLGINPETNRSQMYISDEAAGYLTAFMNSQGAFEYKKQIDQSQYVPTLVVDQPIPYSDTESFTDIWTGQQTVYRDWSVNGPNRCLHYYRGNLETAIPGTIFTSTVPGLTVTEYHPETGDTTYHSIDNEFTYNGKTVYFAHLGEAGWGSFSYSPIPVIKKYGAGFIAPEQLQWISWILWYGNPTGGSPQGISNQAGARVPSYTQNWSTPEEAQQSLQTLYPELYDNAVEVDVLQPDGSIKTITYIPIGTPETTNTTDIQPVTGDDVSQDDTTVGDDSPESQQQTQTKPATNGDQQPPNPPDTGTGDGPISIIPTGAASALWTIYNPTQAQLDSFGGWLWSTNFVDQLKKLFNDPMQSIIGVSKVFAPPPVSGNGTIVVGYLDSNVPSNIVGAQYSTVDCGTVAVSEYFGNVFDYDPFTKISIYLPFIGIKQLNVSDVMRSYINVTYHVDVLSGACLADVNVMRDGNSAGLYQFSGNAAVQYPVSSGSYMGIVSGVLGVAGAIAGAVATGGAAAVPMLTGAAAGLMRSHTQVEHSGSLSGNAGAMGAKKPYLIIERPQTAMAGSFEELQGIPANSYVLLMECSGLTVVDTVHIENIPQATSQELDMIETALKDGVII